MAIIFALSILPVLGLAGGAVDYSRATSSRAALQSAADAAALAGAAMPSAEKLAVARRVFDSNVAKLDGMTATANITLPDAQRVRVEATATVPLKLFSVMSSSGISIGAQSTAIRAAAAPGGSACFYLLDPAANGALRVNGGSQIEAPRCEVHVHSAIADSFILNSGTNLDVSRVCVRGTAIVRGRTGTVQQGCTPDRDPFAGTLPSVSVGACDYNNQVYNAGPPSINLTPGVYCGNTIFNGSPQVNLAPGLYIIKDGPMIFNSGTVVRGIGVTFYFSGSNAGLTMNGQMEMYVDAPTTGRYANILMFQEATLPTRNFIFNNERGQKLSGLIWLPTQDIQFNSRSNGTDTDAVAVVAKTAIMNAQARWRIAPRNGASAAVASGPALLER
ncbi:MAG: pilus assembly protein TadG-related protein [Bosea sp. (in: a-proteobacteria)]